MDTEYRNMQFTEAQMRIARTYYEKNLEPLVLKKGGKDIWYETHIDWWEWGLFQEYETIRNMDFDSAAEYVCEWLKTRDETFYASPRYVEMLDGMLSEIQ
jgi:hypothetical protein